jgi:uncharacterized protein YceK
MKKLAAFLVVLIASGLFCGCASLARKEPSQAYRDPTATGGVYHDYDYRWDGSVGPYTPARIH